MFMPSTRTIALAAIVSLFVLAVPRAHAVQHPDSCEYTCTTDCELNADIVCAGENGIVLTAGADLDLKGFHIICDNPSDPELICGGHAIQIGSSNSVVRDTGSPKGGIVGPFASAIDCQAMAGSRVTGISVNGVDGSALLNCAQADGNVIISRTQLDYVGNPAITAQYVVASVRNNYIANFGVGISAVGTKAVTVDGNVIEPQVPLGGTGFNLTNPVAIVITNTNTGSSVTNNSIIGPGGALQGNATAQFVNNRCDATSAACQTCITAGYCTSPSVPYVLDRSYRMRPASNGDLNQFQLMSPTLVGTEAYLRWLLVNDYPDGEGEITFHSSIANTTPSGSAKTELFHVGDTDSVDPDAEFQSCVLEAHMAAGGAGAPTYLVVKLGGVQSDGPSFSVTSSYPTLFTRVLTTRPAGGRWTGADLLDGTLQIGVKNNAQGIGVTFGDLIFRCK